MEDTSNRMPAGEGGAVMLTNIQKGRSNDCLLDNKLVCIFISEMETVFMTKCSGGLEESSEWAVVCAAVIQEYIMSSLALYTTDDFYMAAETFCGMTYTCEKWNHCT